MDELKNLAMELMPKEYYEQFLYAFEGGRKIRPLLLQSVCRSLEKEATPLRTAALCVEMLHCFTLLHDDVLDNDAIRRGRPAFHTAFSPREAILYGDYFAVLSLRLFQQHYPDMLSVFLETAHSMVMGQLMEFRPLPDMDAYMDYAAKKTASLFTLAARIPLSHYKLERPSLLKASQEFGLAFQIANDLKKEGEHHSILAVCSRRQAEDILQKKRCSLKAFFPQQLLSVLEHNATARTR